MDSNNNSTFWPSYVDIMTTLFATMLVLFAVSYSRFKIKENQLQSLVDEYENIIAVYSTVSSIDSTAYFGYNAKYLKHLFTVDVQYQTKEYDIQNRLKYDKTNPKQADWDPIRADAIRDSVINAGRLIKETLSTLESSESNRNNIKFLVIIEGQSSRMNFFESDWKNNYTLSYMRAQHLYEFWKKNGIDLESSQCQVIISGSGEGGVPRVVPNEDDLKRQYSTPSDIRKAWMDIEAKNQRFLIHIVPVIGNIDVTKEKIDNLKGRS